MRTTAERAALREADWLWMVASALASVALSRVFACAMPFAALATLAALIPDRRGAIGTVLLAWVANQGIGFGLLHYPWTASTLGWGVAIGIAALTGLAAAALVVAHGPRSPWILLPLALVAAFAAYETSLFAATAVLPSGPGAYAPSVVLRLFAINAVALGLLLAARRLAGSAGLAVIRTRPAPRG